MREGHQFNPKLHSLEDNRQGTELRLGAKWIYRELATTACKQRKGTITLFGSKNGYLKKKGKHFVQTVNTPKMIAAYYSMMLLLMLILMLLMPLLLMLLLFYAIIIDAMLLLLMLLLMLWYFIIDAIIIVLFYH